MDKEKGTIRNKAAAWAAVGGILAAAAMTTAAVAPAHSADNPKQTEKPNILAIMTDDLGIWNISAYHRGMMGGRTPNIDRLANEGALFTDYYA